VDTADIKVETPVAMAVRLNGDVYVSAGGVHSGCPAALLP